MIRLASPITMIYCLILTTTAAGETLPVQTLLAVPGAKMPRAGEWIEYVVAFPLDPLEYSIRAQSTAGNGDAPAIAEDADAAPSANAPHPVFDPPTAWGSNNLRLEILKVVDQGCQARMTYNGIRHEVFLPLAPPPEGVAGQPQPSGPSTPDMDVSGDAPIDNNHLADIFDDSTQPASAAQANEPEHTRGKHWLGDFAVDVDIERSGDPHTGYTRMTSPEVPFGLARFANDYLDLILVGKGLGLPPEFPYPDIRIQPSPGKLHRTPPSD